MASERYLFFKVRFSYSVHRMPSFVLSLGPSAASTKLKGTEEYKNPKEHPLSVHPLLSEIGRRYFVQFCAATPMQEALVTVLKKADQVRMPLSVPYSICF